MALLEVKNVTKVYRAGSAPVVALQNVSLEAGKGDFVAVIGKSGCGKSTLLNLCGAMDFPSSGDVVLDEQVTTHLNDAELARLRREKVGFIFQSFQLLHTLTALENVELPLLLAHKPDARKAAIERLCWVEMEDCGSRYPHQLSGGQQQRIAIARALVGAPKVLLADEPTGNLDTATGELVLSLLKRIAHECDVAVLMATHNSESEAFVDRTLRMRDGRLESAAVVL